MVQKHGWLCSVVVLFCALLPVACGSNDNGTTGPASEPKLFVVNGWGVPADNSISKFVPATAITGDVAPTSTITGTSNTQLLGTYGIEYDPRSDAVIVANESSPGSEVLIFDGASELDGDVAPTRVISGPSTSLDTPFDVALDKGRNLLYVAGKHGIAVFANAGTADGDVAPVSLITGTATGFSGHSDMRLALDTSHDRLFVADWLGKTVSVFDNVSTLGGNVAPSRTISGGNTTFSGIWGIAVDVDRDLLYLSDYDTDRVDVFTSASTTSGDIAPTHVLWGGTTTIMGPGDLIIDPGTDTLYLAGGDGNQVLVWNNASTVDGDVAPDRAVVGASTGFKYPADLVLAP